MSCPVATLHVVGTSWVHCVQLPALLPDTACLVWWRRLLLSSARQPFLGAFSGVQSLSAYCRSVGTGAHTA